MIQSPHVDAVSYLGMTLLKPISLIIAEPMSQMPPPWIFEDFRSMDLDLRPDIPYSLTNEASHFTHVPFVDEISPYSGYAMGLYGHHSPISESFLSHADVEDETMIQGYQLLEPVLQSPILFGSLADTFHGVLAQCMSNPYPVHTVLLILLKMIKIFVSYP
jgi:hypothetical protein